MPFCPRPSSRQIFGSCVVLPEPVSPETMITWLSSKALAISARRPETGKSSGYVIGGSGLRKAFPPRARRAPHRGLRGFPAPARRTRGLGLALSRALLLLLFLLLRARRLLPLLAHGRALAALRGAWRQAWLNPPLAGTFATLEGGGKLIAG